MTSATLVLGTTLERLCREARRDILLVAPFAKQDVVARLLESVPPNVTVRCVTRWRLEEIVAGVSDIGVWQLLRNRPYSSMWLRLDLHAKYYRVDERCLIGSANLTSTALGWAPQPNLELLIPLEADHEALNGFEPTMLAGCVQVDDALFAQVAEAVRLIEQQDGIAPVSGSSTLAEAHADHVLPSPSVDAWLPTLRNPGDLYLVYSGGADRLSAASRAAADFDLQALPVSPRLSRSSFEACVGALLLQKPVIKAVDDFAITPRRFGAVRALLQRLPCGNQAGFDAARSWQTLMRWMLEFLPNRYGVTVPNHSEVFFRSDVK